MKQITIDVGHCTGCGQCALNCSFKNTGTFDLSQSSIHVVQWEDICLSVPQVCQQCKQSPCILVCPSDALSLNPNTGAIQLDTAACSQCGACETECTYQVIHITYDGYPQTCDLCGGNPQCVLVCYPGALHFEEIAEKDKEPFHPLAGILIDRAAGKNVPAPEELKARSVT